MTQPSLTERLETLEAQEEQSLTWFANITATLVRIGQRLEAHPRILTDILHEIRAERRSG